MLTAMRTLSVWLLSLVTFPSALWSGELGSEWEEFIFRRDESEEVLSRAPRPLELVEDIGELKNLLDNNVPSKFEFSELVFQSLKKEWYAHAILFAHYSNKHYGEQSFRPALLPPSGGFGHFLGAQRGLPQQEEELPPYRIQGFIANSFIPENPKNRANLIAAVLPALDLMEPEFEAKYPGVAFARGGGLSTVIGLMRDYQEPIERGDVYPWGIGESQAPLSWWKMPYEMSTWAGVEGLRAPVTQDIIDRDWEAVAWHRSPETGELVACPEQEDGNISLLERLWLYYGDEIEAVRRACTLH